MASQQPKTIAKKAHHAWNKRPGEMVGATLGPLTLILFFVWRYDRRGRDQLFVVEVTLVPDLSCVIWTSSGASSKRWPGHTCPVVRSG